MPRDPRYKAAEAAARTARREAAEKKRQAERNFIDMRNEWASPWRRRPVTMVMIVTCVALALGVLGNLGDALVFSMPAIQLYDLGTLIERRIGSVRFSLLVLIVALVSNYTQFVAQGPNFVGMSGVVYGLFGYCWVRGRIEPTSGLYLRPNVAFIMLAWFVICAAGLIGNVANFAHGGGLVAGCVLGYLPHILKTLRQNT
jgi:GlpG protein